MEMSALPEDELLHVLSFLDHEELLRVRQVCRRWRDLALRPQLWRQFDLCFYKDGRIWRGSGAALTLAPCGAELTMGFNGLEGDMLQEAFPLLLETTCAFESVTLETCDKGLVMPALTIKRQAALGRLRKVELQVGGDALSCRGLPFLLQTLENVTGLVELRLDLSPVNASPPSLFPTSGTPPPMVASLRNLTLLVDPLEPHLSRYLDRHSTTLRYLCVKTDSPGLAERLAQLPNLRELSCHQLSNMSALLESPSLRSLSLWIDFKSGEPSKVPLATVAAYLRASTGSLEDIFLELPYDDPDQEVVNLVMALAGPGGPVHSVLQALSFQFKFKNNKDQLGQGQRLPPPLLHPLASVLHRLPRLQYLELGGNPSPEFLDVIDPAVLPELRVLVARHVGDSKSGCAHKWLHSASVQSLVTRCPELHLWIFGGACDCSGSEKNGSGPPFCPQLKCHPEFMKDWGRICLFPHVKGKKCRWCAMAESERYFKCMI